MKCTSRVFYGLIAGVLLLLGCDSDERMRVNEYDYFPLRLNRPLIYKVTETRYSASSSEPVVTIWEEKDEGIRRSESPDGFPVFVFSRSRRSASGDVWQKVKEYTVTSYPDKYLLSVDNLITVPLVFPFSSTDSWNLNDYNTREPERCTYVDLHQERTLNDLHFSKTIQVSGRSHVDDPIVRYNLGYSRYALGIGLIYDEQTDYDYCQEEHCFGQQQIMSGVSTIKELVAYSEE